MRTSQQEAVGCIFMSASTSRCQHICKAVAVLPDSALPSHDLKYILKN